MKKNFQLRFVKYVKYFSIANYFAIFFWKFDEDVIDKYLIHKTVIFPKVLFFFCSLFCCCSYLQKDKERYTWKVSLVCIGKRDTPKWKHGLPRISHLFKINVKLLKQCADEFLPFLPPKTDGTWEWEQSSLMTSRPELSQLRRKKLSSTCGEN